MPSVAILPFNTPIGIETVTATSDGQISAGAPITVVQNKPYGQIIHAVRP
jgi:hypothetical protein